MVGENDYQRTYLRYINEGPASNENLLKLIEQEGIRLNRGCPEGYLEQMGGVYFLKGTVITHGMSNVNTGEMTLELTTFYNSTNLEELADRLEKVMEVKFERKAGWKEFLRK